eukprot:6173155-Pleurochrysis_carterae.AAC.1
MEQLHDGRRRPKNTYRKCEQLVARIGRLEWPHGDSTFIQNVLSLLADRCDAHCNAVIRRRSARAHTRAQCNHKTKHSRKDPTLDEAPKSARADARTHADAGWGCEMMGWNGRGLWWAKGGMGSAESDRRRGRRASA